MAESLKEYLGLSAEYLVHYILFGPFLSEPNDKRKACMLAAMQVPLRIPAIFSELTTLVESGDIDATIRFLQANRQQTGGRSLAVAAPSIQLPAIPQAKQQNALDSIADIYISMEDPNAALDLLRYLLFFPNPSTLEQFISNYKRADVVQRKEMISPIIWNAESI